MKQYDISSETPAGTYVQTVVGERFTIRMPEVSGRIIDPIGQHGLVDHSCRTEGGGVVEFEMIALKSGNDLVEFRLIDDGWDGASDPDPAKSEPYTSLLVVVGESRLSRPDHGNKGGKISDPPVSSDHRDARAGGMEILRLLIIAQGLESYAKTKMLPNRACTPTTMLCNASIATGKQYKRGQYREAASDLRRVIEILQTSGGGMVETGLPVSRS